MISDIHGWLAVRSCTDGVVYFLQLTSHPPGSARICQLYKSVKVSPPTSRFCGTPASDDQFENFWGHKSWSSARWAAPTSSVERSFSALKHIKTHARNSTGQDRLGALALMSIEKSLLLELKSKDKLYDAALAHFSCKVGLCYKPPWLLFQGIKITGCIYCRGCPSANCL